MNRPASRPLRIYVPSFRADRHWWPTVLEPLGPDLAQAPPSDYQRRVAGEWLASGRAMLRAVAPESADVAVLPFALEALLEVPQLRFEAARLASDAREQGLPMLVFCHGDIELSSPGRNCVIFRTSSHVRRLASTDVPMPAWVMDPEEEMPVGARPWSARPVVSFVGQAYPLGVTFPSRLQSWIKWGKAITKGGLTVAGVARHVGAPEYHFDRAAAVLALRHARDIDGQILVRQAMTRLDMGRAADRRLHLEFLAALAAADYVLAPRGGGNYSYRLYESLACGRPAITVDSGMPFPCRHEVPWDDLVLALKARQLPRLSSYVRSRHTVMEPRWLELQALCRGSWKSFLCANGFFTRLVANVTSTVDAGDADPARLAAALR